MFQLPILPHPGPVSSSFIRPQTSDGSDPHVCSDPHMFATSPLSIWRSAMCSGGMSVHTGRQVGPSAGTDWQTGG